MSTYIICLPFIADCHCTVVAELFKFMFPVTMLKLSDEELETEANNLQIAYSADLGDDLVSEVRSFRREFSEEIKKCESVKDVLTLLLSSDVLSSMPELGTACILFCTLPVTVATAERSFSKLKLNHTYALLSHKTAWTVWR